MMPFEKVAKASLRVDVDPAQVMRRAATSAINALVEETSINHIPLDLPESLLSLQISKRKADRFEPFNEENVKTESASVFLGEGVEQIRRGEPVYQRGTQGSTRPYDTKSDYVDAESKTLAKEWFAVKVDSNGINEALRSSQNAKDLLEHRRTDSYSATIMKEDLSRRSVEHDGDKRSFDGAFGGPTMSREEIENLRRIAKESQDRILKLEADLMRTRLTLETEQAESSRLKDDLARKTREISSLVNQIETLSSYLDVARSTDANAFVTAKKDSVFELESLKARLSRAERERDVFLFQVQEIERRTRQEKDEETALREEASTRAAENERKASYAELQRARAEAEAGAARQQIEHWRTAARMAQDELAALRAQQDFASRFKSVPSGYQQVPPPPPPVALNNGGSVPHSAHSIVDVSGPRPSGGSTSPRDAQVAAALLNRQLQLVTASMTPMSDSSKDKTELKVRDIGTVMRADAEKRLQQIAEEIARLDDALADVGPASGRSHSQRKQAMVFKKQIEELNREAGRIRATLS